MQNIFYRFLATFLLLSSFPLVLSAELNPHVAIIGADLRPITRKHHPAIHSSYRRLSAQQRANKAKIEVYFADIPEMEKISYCESGFKQFDSAGDPLESDTGDIGLFQLSKNYWLDYADKLGYDIYTIDGNMAMAKYLYEKNKFNDWSASKKCWNNEG